ncbi:MAG: hypothetical protein ACK5O1_02880 [Holosporales bacterium]
MLMTKPWLSVLLAGVLTAVLSVGMALLPVLMIFSILPLLLIGVSLSWQAALLAGTVAWGVYSGLLFITPNSMGFTLDQEPILSTGTWYFLHQNTLFFLLRIVVPAVLLCWLRVKAKTLGKNIAWLNFLFLHGIVVTIVGSWLLAPVQEPIIKALNEISLRLTEDSQGALTINKNQLVLLASLISGFSAAGGFITIALNMWITNLVCHRCFSWLRMQPLTGLSCLLVIVGAFAGIKTLDDTILTTSLLYYTRNLGIFAAAPITLLGFGVFQVIADRWQLPTFLRVGIIMLSLFSLYPLVFFFALGFVEPLLPLRARLHSAHRRNS